MTRPIDDDYDGDDSVYVALGTNLEEGRLTLVWALQNLDAETVCILHVHQIDKSIIPLMSGLSLANEVEEHERRTIADIERKLRYKILDNYLNICRQAAVNVRVLKIDSNNVGEAIMHLILQNNVKRLVMGASSDKNYSPGMTEIKSRKAKYVRQHAPRACQLWFTCRGKLIQRGNCDGYEAEGGRNRDEGESNTLLLYIKEELEKERAEHAKTKEERDHLAEEHDNAMELLVKQLGEASTSTYASQLFPELSSSEIHEATSAFDQSLKIAEDGYGKIYKGFLHHTPVVVKILAESQQVEFQRKVEHLSELRHRNIVTFLGSCQELRALVFEYLPNGSLADRLGRKDDSPPLSWKTRVRIASELCSLLIFLHSRNSHTIAHGRLIARDILLDENFVCKVDNIGDANADSLESDIYSFGVILLQLLTGKTSSCGLVEQMRDAVHEDDELKAMLDASCEERPFVQASQLAHLALRCCEDDPDFRLDLASEYCSVLKPMRASCGPLSPFSSQAPSHFICPISQDVMTDPHFAADGYTYEAEFLRSWIEGGHNTSPMTNKELEHHNLIPNYSLRSAIQEWRQHHSILLE